MIENEAGKNLVVWEDDLIEDPWFERNKLRQGLANLLYLDTLQGKIWFGHSYRLARESLYDQDCPMRLSVVCRGLIAVANALDQELVKECVSLALQDIRDKKVGIPHVQPTNLEKLAETREKMQEEDREWRRENEQ